MDAIKSLAALAIGLAATSVVVGQNDTEPVGSASTFRAATPRTSMTRQRDFYIPFQLANNGPDQTIQVRLYVSSDQGVNWTLYQTQPARAAKFQFHTPADGEFWFAVRTVDRQGQRDDHQGWQPELIVVVDTQLPRLELHVDVDNQGNIQADWLAQDPHLAAHTFRLQYQDGQAQKWQDVQLETPEADDVRQQWEHEAGWWLRPTGDEVLVRAQVSDRAGNSTLVNKRISVARVAQRHDAESGPRRFAVARDAFPGAGPNPGDRPLPTATTPWQDDANAWRAGAQQALRDPPPRWLSDDPGPNTTAQTRIFLDQDGKEHLTRSPADQPVPSQVAPPVANRYVPQDNGPESLGQRPRITSTPEFELAYDLYDVGPNGASLVDLWYTRDRGRTWERYGSDNDKESPMEVRLQREGLYGFRLVVYSQDAPEPRPPQDGEPADIWVGVDWTKPVGRIISVRYGDGIHKNSLLITWQAEDALLGERPITLNFGETPGGPWIPIAAQLPNSGSYTWQLDRRAPWQLYLQLEVRDLAGNVTSHEFERPILTQGHAPKGRIRDLRPINKTSLRPSATPRR